MRVGAPAHSRACCSCALRSLTPARRAKRRTSRSSTRHLPDRGCTYRRAGRRQLLGVGIEVVSVVAWAVDNGKHDKFVRIDARNRDGDIVLGIPLPPESAATLADQLRDAAAEIVG